MSFENLLFASGAAVNSKIVDSKLNECVNNQIRAQVKGLYDLYILEQGHEIYFYLPVKCLWRFLWPLCLPGILLAILFQHRQGSFELKFWEKL